MAMDMDTDTAMDMNTNTDADMDTASMETLDKHANLPASPWCSQVQFYRLKGFRKPLLH